MMAESLQAASALLSLAELATKAAILIKRVLYDAHDDARKLWKSIKSFSKLIHAIEADLERTEQLETSVTNAHLQETIKESIQELVDESGCVLRDLISKLDGVATKKGVVKISNLPPNVKFVFKTKYIREQQRKVDENIRLFTLWYMLLARLEQEPIPTDQSAAVQSKEQNSQPILIQIILQGGFGRDIPAEKSTSESLGELRRMIQEQSVPGLLEQLRGTIEQPSNPRAPQLEDLLQSTNVDQISETTEVDELDSTDEPGIHDEPLQIEYDEPIVEPKSPLWIAIKENDYNEVKSLLQNGADLMATNDDGQTLLHYAAHQRAPKALDAVLDSTGGVSFDFVDAKDLNGFTALIEAAQWSDAPCASIIAETLLKSNCNVNDVDGAGRSALYHSCQCHPDHQRQTFFNLLMRYGADYHQAEKTEGAPVHHLKRYMARWEAMQQPKSPISKKRRRDTNGSFSSMLGLDTMKRVLSRTSISSDASSPTDAVVDGGPIRSNSS